MKKGLLICLSGVDGVGKTSLAVALTHSLNSRGLAGRYVYGRYTPFSSKPVKWLIYSLLLRKKESIEGFKELNEAKKRFFENSLLHTLYALIVMIGCVLLITRKVVIPLRKGEVVICDRYFLDTLINDILMNPQFVRGPVLALAKLFLACIPKPELIFLVYAPQRIAYTRKDDIPSIRYLQERDSLYSTIGLGYELTFLDGSRNFSEVLADVQKKVMTLVNSSGT